MGEAGAAVVSAGTHSKSEKGVAEVSSTGMDGKGPDGGEDGHCSMGAAEEESLRA